jgi:hypothetical protein
VIAFIDAHRDRFGVEPICRVLTEHGCKIAPNTYWVARKRPPSKRACREAELIVEIRRVYAENLLLMQPLLQLEGIHRIVRRRRLSKVALLAKGTAWRLHFDVDGQVTKLVHLTPPDHPR